MSNPDEIDYDIVVPDPSALIESLRAFGYSPETAIADLVDNSITAKAASIRISFDWAGPESLIYIIDDGRGMTSSELIDAMRAGSKSPRFVRDPQDLGRFGLGLKTASFSQCRQLTVASKTKDHSITVRKWDLDEVELTSEWRLLKSASPAAQKLIYLLDAQPSGTIVIWENLDRILGSAGGNESLGQTSFYKISQNVESHLSMIFHRLIGARLKIFVGSDEIRKWDPFLENNPSRQVLGMERIRCGNSYIEVEGVVLPHRSNLSTEEFSAAAGSRGWNDLQGFYVYRNQRLIVAGDWLGLRYTKEEHYKLARIRIDISNDMDDLWQIDVRKSEAVPPAMVRDELRRVAGITRERATEVYRHRGRVFVKMAAQGIALVWNKKINRGKISYSLNRDHPIVQEAIVNPNSRTVGTLLRLVEETIPIPQITIDAAEQPEIHAAPLETATPRQIIELATEILEVQIRKGKTFEEAIATVLSTEPFNHFPELNETLRKGNVK